MNCIIIDDDIMSRKILEEFISRTEQLNLINSFENAVDAINTFKNNDDIDLIFLDIEMPEMNGIEFLESLENPPQIIIVSSKDKYALQAFNYDVTDYLLKPITYSRFFKAVNKANVRFKNKIENSSEEIFIKKNSAIIKLKYDDILWIEALENYVVFVTFKEKHMVHFTMKALDRKLPANRFIRVHRSYIVNIKNINVIEDNTIIFNTSEGPKSVPIGKSYRDNLLREINLIDK